MSQKTMKVLNLDCGAVLRIEAIYSTETKTFRVYRKGYNWKEGVDYPVKFRKKIHECTSIVDILDFISNYCKTGEYTRT